MADDYCKVFTYAPPPIAVKYVAAAHVLRAYDLRQIKTSEIRIGDVSVTSDVTEAIKQLYNLAHRVLERAGAP